MKKSVVLGVAASIALSGAQISASPTAIPNPVMGGQTQVITGHAKDATSKTLAKVTVRVRRVNPPPGTSSIAGTATTTEAGAFSIPVADAGNYVVEILDANGNVIGTSAGLTVAAGATVTVDVTASALLAAASSGTAAGAGIGGAGFGTTATVAAIASGATIATIAVIKANASASR
jgi:hypothetical protein